MKNKNETLAAANKIERPERLTLRKNREMFYEKFRTNLRVLVGSTSITAVQLATNAGLESGSRLTGLQYGRCNPEVEELTCIAEYFKITIDDLLNKVAVITFK